jgi:Secretion system C-terminal sorting domain
LACVELQGQDWSYVYDHDLTYDDFVALEIQNDTIYTVSANWNADTSLFGMTFFKMDSTGHVVDTAQFYESNRILSTYRKYSGFKIHNKNLYFFGTTNQYYTYLIKANTDFTQDTIIYYPPNPGVNFTGATGLLATESGLYLLAQQKKPGELNDIMVIHTDLDGKELWRKVFGTSNAEEMAQSILTRNSNSIVIGGQKASSYFGSYLNAWSKEWILKIDSSGNIVSEWSSSDVPNRSLIRGMHILGDSYIYTSSINQYLSDTDFRATNNFCKRDTANLNLIWQTDIPSPNNNWYSAIWNTCLTPDGTGITGVGRKDYGGPGFHYKLNTESGAIIYKRNIEGCTEEYEAIDMDLFDIACLSSGSTVACGYTVLNTPIAPAYTGWVIKTNPWGLDLLDECSTVPVIEAPSYTGVDMKIYPNPASSQVTLALPESKEAYQIRLVNTQGHLMYQIDNQAVNPTIDVSGLADGMYFVQILDKRGTVLSVGRIVKIE